MPDESKMVKRLKNNPTNQTAILIGIVVLFTYGFLYIECFLSTFNIITIYWDTEISDYESKVGRLQETLVLGCGHGNG